MVEHRVSVPRLRSVRMKGGGASVTVLRGSLCNDVGNTLRAAAAAAVEKGGVGVAVVVAHASGVMTTYHADTNGVLTDLIGGLADVQHRIMVKRWGDDV